MNDRVFTLTERERAELAATAGTLAAHAPGLVDDETWIGAARRLSCRLGVRVRERMRDFRHDPGDGVLLLRNLPSADAGLPPTPMERDSVQRRATLGSAVIALVSMQLGELIAFRNEKSGALVQNVVPVPGRERQQSNAGSVPLELHVENAFHPYRPDYVALLCLRNDHDGAAGLQTASIRRAVTRLPAETRKVLAEPRYLTESPPSFGSPELVAPEHAVLNGDFDDPDIRVDFHATRPLDEEAGRALEGLRAALDAVTEAISLEPGDLAMVDNRLVLHGRTRFQPRYDGRDRWLHRAFVHVDHRRSRSLRSAGGHVLS